MLQNESEKLRPSPKNGKKLKRLPRPKILVDRPESVSPPERNGKE